MRVPFDLRYFLCKHFSKIIINNLWENRLSTCLVSMSVYNKCRNTSINMYNLPIHLSFLPCWFLLLSFNSFFWLIVSKNCSCDWEKLYQLWGWMPIICNFFWSLDNFIRTMKYHNNFWKRILFKWFLLKVS